MGKALGAIVVVLAIAAGVVFGVPSIRAKVVGVPLKMQFRQGAETSMRMNLEGKVKLEANGIPKNLDNPQVQMFLGKDIPFKMEMRYKQTVKSVNGDTADVETAVESGNIEVTLPGTPQPIKYPLPPGAPSTATMDTHGRVKLPSTVSTPAGVSADDMKKLQEFIGNLSGGFLTGETTRVGQTWSQDASLPIKNDKVSVNITGKINDRFESVEKRNNVNVANIAGDQDITIDVSTPTPAPMGMPEVKLKGNVTGNNHGYFDWSSGQVVGSEGEGKLDLTVTVKMSVPQQVDANAHLTGSMKVTLEKL